MILLENNVAYEVAEKIIEKLEGDIVNKEMKKSDLESKTKLFEKSVIIIFLQKKLCWKYTPKRKGTYCRKNKYDKAEGRNILSIKNENKSL